MALNIRLKMAFMERGVRQQDIARRTGIQESRLSRIIHGWLKPTLDEKKALAKALRKPVDELFEPRVAA